MNQVIIYFAINASLLAMFAGLWGLDVGRRRGRRALLDQKTAINPTAIYPP